MNTSLANVLDQIDNLSYDELLTVQEKIIHRLRTKGPTSNGQTNSATSQPPTSTHNRKLKIPGLILQRRNRLKRAWLEFSHQKN